MQVTILLIPKLRDNKHRSNSPGLSPSISQIGARLAQESNIATPSSDSEDAKTILPRCNIAATIRKMEFRVISLIPST